VIASVLSLLVPLAAAGSLDTVEVGGAWGSPTATNATAMWWNPAGVAAGTGTRFLVEGAPTLAAIRYDRADANGYEGADTLDFFGVVPFAGFATDAGVSGLGLGAAVAMPFARAGRSRSKLPIARDYTGDIPVTDGVGRYSTRTGKIDALHIVLGGGWDLGRVAFGAGGALVLSSWTASLDNTTLPLLDGQIRDLGQVPDYTDAMMEDPSYATTLDFDVLRDTTFTFNAGVQVDAVPDTLTVGLSYVNGARTDNKGDVLLQFACPPQSDVLGRFGSEAFGLCNTDLRAAGRVQYRLPSRLSAGLHYTPTDTLALELMGGWVGWSTFQDFEVSINQVGVRNNEADFNDLAATAQLVNQTRLWARDNHNSLWVAADGKVAVNDQWTVGGRLLFDQSAVPDQALMLNNFDTNQLVLTALGRFSPTEHLSVGLTVSQYVAFRREITDSGFSMTLDPDAAKPDRWFYPQANGTYSGRITRVGLSLQGAFGQG